MAEVVTAASTESAAEQSANGAQTASEQQQIVDPKAIASQNFGKGINEERQRLAEDLKAFGIEPVVNELGHVDRKASLAALAEHITKQAAAEAEKAKAATKSDDTPLDEKEQAHKAQIDNYVAQLDATNKRAQENEERAKAAEERALRTLEDSYVKSAFVGLPVEENSGELVVKLFKLERKVRQIADGEVRVYNGREVIFADDGKGGVRAATVEEAARMFLDEHPQLMAPQARPAHLQSEAVAGVRHVSATDAMNGKIPLKDIVSGAAQIR